MTSRTLIRSFGIITGVLCSIVAQRGRGDENNSPMPPATKEHMLLKNDVGTWDATVKFWEKPGAEPMESKATEENHLLPGGLWLTSHFTSDFGGMPFTGIGTFGYDPVEKKYVGTWIDSMTPYMMTMKGDYDADTKTMNTIGEGRDAMTGKMTKWKLISRYADKDTRSFEMHMPGEDGKYWKMMEIQYKRRASKP